MSNNVILMNLFFLCTNKSDNTSFDQNDAKNK